tara:strand:+ start:417 stop:758 length:342 start_codon:yes stop_codon:yes gene_type:complete
VKILTNPILKQLKANSARQQENDESMSTMPVVKLFGGGACTWLLSELDDDGIAFGLCDLGMGSPELGYVSMDELMSIKFPPFGLPIERDMNWKPNKTLVEYADEARRYGRLVA